MSFQAGTATSPIDLLQQLVTWLVSIGWTTDLSASEGSGWRAHLHNSGNYVHLRALMNEQMIGGANGYGVALYLSTSFSNLQPWATQPGNPPYQSSTTTVVAAATQLAGAGAVASYHFFADTGGTNIVVVTERTAGIFGFIGWGDSLVKAGSWTGGPYFFGSVGNGSFGQVPNLPGITLTSYCPGSDGDWANNAAMFVRADVDAFTGKWLGVSSNNLTGKVAESSIYAAIGPSSNLVRYAQSTASNYLQWRTTSVLHAEANLLPVLIFATRDSGGMSLLGSLPLAFWSNAVGNGFAAASDYLLGSDTFTMFPNFAVQKV